MEDDPLLASLSIINQVDFHFLNVESFVSATLILILLVFSALISGSEVAYFSLSRTDLDIPNKKDKGLLVLKLLSKPNELLATILIVNNFVNVGIIILAAFFTEVSMTFEEGSSLEFLFQVFVITGILVLIGEITPKVYAHQHALRFSNWMARPLTILKKLVFPLAYLLVKSTSIIDNRLKKKREHASIEEISKALDLAGKESREEEKRILRSILEFGNTDVKEIMKSRVDVIAIEEKELFSNVLKLIISSGFSRIPVYRQQFDNVLGILYIKDLIPYLNKGDDFEWIKFCRAPYFIPENKMINDLLKEFQVKKNHIAIVVDEYGGASGIVTLEDVLEEIVGEINDEFDDEENVYSKLDNSNFIFEGKIPLIDFLKIVKGEPDYFDDIKGEADTLAGFILEIKGEIPKIGITVTHKPYTFKIESADRRRIKWVKVTIR
ncbi:MAG: gliding motility-associated protein GldE [Bacteroidota bacterium]|nr:gliding motility-associated protein GldE [Bacteroidota bacterium]